MIIRSKSIKLATQKIKLYSSLDEVDVQIILSSEFRESRVLIRRAKKQYDNRVEEMKIGAPARLLDSLKFDQAELDQFSFGEES